MQDSTLFKTIPEKDYFNLYSPHGKVDINKIDFDKVIKTLQLKQQDVSKATGVNPASVRYDARIPKPLQERLTEWAVLLNFVAQYFQGDAKKAIFWFNISNPMLGNVKPRDMIRFGRSKKLLNFVLNALQENSPDN